MAILIDSLFVLTLKFVGYNERQLVICTNIGASNLYSTNKVIF